MSDDLFRQRAANAVQELYELAGRATIMPANVLEIVPSEERVMTPQEQRLFESFHTLAQGDAQRLANVLAVLRQTILALDQLRVNIEDSRCELLGYCSTIEDADFTSRARSNTLASPVKMPPGAD
jgi:hypothetical protein